MKRPAFAPSTIWRASVLEPPALRATVTPVLARYKPAISSSASYTLAATDTTKPLGCAATGALRVTSTVRPARNQRSGFVICRLIYRKPASTTSRPARSGDHHFRRLDHSQGIVAALQFQRVDRIGRDHGSQRLVADAQPHLGE